MLVVRCYTCNKLLAHKQAEYTKYLNDGEQSSAEALTMLGINRFCCRRIMISSSNVFDVIASNDTLDKLDKRADIRTENTNQRLISHIL